MGSSLELEKEWASASSSSVISGTKRITGLLYSLPRQYKVATRVMLSSPGCSFVTKARGQDRERRDSSLTRTMSPTRRGRFGVSR